MIHALVIVPAVYGDIGIAPQLKELKIHRGGRSEFHLLVANHSSETVSLEMLADDMDVSEAGRPFAAEEGYERGCAKWVTFTPREFSLEAKASQDVQVRVKSPTDAIGSYFAILSCRLTRQEMLRIPTDESGAKGVELGIRVGSLLLTTVSTSKNTVIIQPDTVRLDPGKSTRGSTLAEAGEGGGGHWKVEVPVANAGNVYTIVQGEASIWTEAGRLVARAPLFAGRGFVFPNRHRIFTATGDKPLPDGAYLVRANISSREGRTRSGSFPFTVVSGVARAGSESEEIQSLLRASLPEFSLQKQYLEFDIQPGGHRTKGVTVTSHAQDTLKLVARLLDWNVDNEGAIKLLSDGNSNQLRSCTSWLSISPNPLVIAPDHKKIVKMLVRAPAEIDGEYYAAVLFDLEGAKHNLPSEFKVPRTLFVVASAKRSVKPSAIIRAADSRRTSRKGCLFEIEFENMGNTHCFASGRLTLLDQQGDRVSDPVAFGGEGEFILPGGIRTFLVPWQGDLEPERYRAEISIDYHKDARGLHETITFQVK